MKALVRSVLVFLALWGLLFLLAKVLRISPSWPLWCPALVTAVVVESIVWLYRYERGAVTVKRGRLLLGLRLLALAILLWILLEPTWIHKITHHPDRQVIVVIDQSASMQLQDDGTEQTREALAEKSLADAKVIETLSETMKVRTIRAARSVRNGSGASADGWADATDLAAALSHVLEEVPPDELAGVVLVSDGRHNRPERVEDVARRFGILDAPVGVLAVGSEKPPMDAAVISVEAPEAMHLGDRMRIAAKVKFDGYKGKKAKVELLRGEKILEQRELTIPQEHHREDMRFVHLPEEDGVGDYQIRIAALEGEKFSDNNAWQFETSITDARTNVLVVDSYPRWEFRYLRNLFYGRDKSVHLQYVLLHPDEIAGQSIPSVAASAGRAFGEAQATRLPETEAEWQKFDVIILGDVEAEAIDAATWQIISRCVNERAALLVMIAGPRSMPHALLAEEARALVPADVEWANREYFQTDAREFRWMLTPEGASHAVTQQATGERSNEQVWAGFPTLAWRHPIKSVKEGADVLLAEAPKEQARAAASGADLTDALADLALRKQRQAESALLVTRQTGKGKVALLLTDRTWRLREGAGDVFHHRFWGNLVRWGAGPTLRAGAQQVRLGTDQLTYTPDDSVKVTARLRDNKMGPVENAEIQAELLKDGAVVDTIALQSVVNSNGLYESTFTPRDHAGRYEIRLRGAAVDEARAADGLSEVGTSIRVVGSRGPVEMAETTLHLPLLETVASLSGGKVSLLDEAAELPKLFLRNKAEKQELREISLWDHLGVLVLLALVLTIEWMMRRAGGLP
jgi:hypothetical protein